MVASSQPPEPGPAFIDWAEFFAKERDDPEWVIEGVLARGRGHSIYARHGTGKSLFSLWCATQAAQAGNLVLYADYEQSEDDLYERLTDMGFHSPVGLERLRYLLLPSIRPLDTEGGAADFLAILDGVRIEDPGAHVVVILDTISRAVAGEENSNDTIQNFYRYTGIELKQRGCTWARLDHTGWEGSHARGGSAKGDDVDVVWRMSPTDEGIELKADKRRMGWVPDRTLYKITTDPLLAYTRQDSTWPAGTRECANDLDFLGVPLDASTRAARTALREDGRGRRNNVIEAAQRWRRMGAEAAPVAASVDDIPPEFG